MCLPKAPKFQAQPQLALPAPVAPIKAEPIPEAITPLPEPEKRATTIAAPEAAPTAPPTLGQTFKRIGVSALRIPLQRLGTRGDINVP